MTAAQIAAALGGARKIRSGWQARCPAHDDRNPSLSVSDAGDKILVYCHAGCAQDVVIESLRARGLWPARERRKSDRGPDRLGPVVAEYLYRAEDDTILFRVTRHVPKAFRQWRPDGHGGWLPGVRGVRMVPYQLPRLIVAQVVFIVEGEADTETLREWGFTATCNPGGAGKWRSEWGPFFRNKDVIIVPDADEPGIRHARQVAEALLPYAARLAVIRLPGAKDVTEWFERGHSEVELCSLVDMALAPWEMHHVA